MATESLKVNDGESSVIAVCKHSFAGANCIPIIDERRGREAAVKYLEGKECGYSLNRLSELKILCE